MSVADRVEIADLYARFALLLDEKRWADAGTVFTEDVTARATREGDLHGLDTLIEFMRGTEVEGVRSQHLTTDLLVDVDGDRATASANSLVYFFRDGAPPHRTGGLRLTGVLVRTPAGWRLRESETAPLWISHS